MKLSIALLASGAAALAPNVQRATQLAYRRAKQMQHSSVWSIYISP